MKYREITEKIIAASFAVSNELGHGYLESVYEKALIIALREQGLQVQAQFPLTVTFHGQNVGEFIADVFVEKQVIVELKSVARLLPEHQAQLINYLKATGIPVGLLVNFGTPRVTIKRVYWDAENGSQTHDIAIAREDSGIS